MVSIGVFDESFCSGDVNTVENFCSVFRCLQINILKISKVFRFRMEVARNGAVEYLNLNGFKCTRTWSPCHGKVPLLVKGC